MTYIPTIKENEIYGYWTVINIISASKIECECKCGYKKTHRQTDLLRGVTTKCPDCHLKRQPTTIQLGAQFGDWVVINILDFQYQLAKGKKIERKWHCQCKCGVEKWIRTSHLNGGLTRSCSKCSNIYRRLGKVGNLPLTDINRYKYGAKIRKYEWSLTNNYLWELYQKQDGKCSLSGVDLSFSESGIGKKGAKDVSTASLDRIDSTKGYTAGNVQWIHKDINKMKNNQPQESFLEWCKLINNYNK